MPKPAYRMYIDEVGNHDLKPAYRHANDQYLSLTGLIMSLDDARDVLAPRLDDLKRRYFDSHPDNPVILHRREIVRRSPPFHALKDDVTRQAFGQELLRLVEDLPFSVVTVVIDKAAHLARYRAWSDHPYHYCLENLLERYCHELRTRRLHGDVMAESRGGREDRALKTSYRAHHERGTSHVSKAALAAHITSQEIKLQKKSDNVPGLQLADLLAYPSWKATRARRDGTLLDGFTAEIADVLERSKYRRGPGGRVDGYGRKWLP